jgi:RHS repeat-associated protein
MRVDPFGTSWFSSVGNWFVNAGKDIGNFVENNWDIIVGVGLVAALYKGYYYDFETLMYYCKSRYYIPLWSRWLNADDISYLDPSSINGLNLYAYCGNNRAPVRCI